MTINENFIESIADRFIIIAMINIAKRTNNKELLEYAVKWHKEIKK